MAETFEAYRIRILSYLGDEEPIDVQQATPSQLDRRPRPSLLCSPFVLPLPSFLTLPPNSGYFTVCLTTLRIRRLHVHGLEKGWAADCLWLRNIIFDAPSLW